MNTFENRLREERKRLGLNQADFAAIAGQQKNSQVNYETGRRHPDSLYLSALAAHGVDVLYVLTGRNEDTHASSATDSISNSTLIRAIELVEQGLRDNSARLAPDKYAGLVIAVADFLESDTDGNATEAVGNIIRFAS